MSICLITRTQPGSDASVEALRHLGFEAVAVPAAIIEPVDALIDLEGVQALLMTSAAAARHVSLSPQLLALPVYAVGDMTATIAGDIGFETVISAGGDGAALAVLAADRLKPNDGALLHIRGQEVAGDVTGMLNACGFETRFQEVYRTIDEPHFRARMQDFISHNNGAIIIHSPAGGRRIAAALTGFEKHLHRWTIFGLSSPCNGPLGTFGFKARFYAEKPDEKVLIDMISANHSHFGP